MENQTTFSKHVEEAAKTTAAMQFDHLYKSTRLQNSIARITIIVGKPAFILTITAFILMWMSINIFAPIFGYEPSDPYPFFGLSFWISSLALYVSLIILATQHRDEEISWQREEFSLQLAILNEQKMSKLIQLVDELRKSQVGSSNAIDKEAHAMSSAEDLKKVQESVLKNREKIFDADKSKI